MTFLILVLKKIYIKRENDCNTKHVEKGEILLRKILVIKLLQRKRF